MKITALFVQYKFNDGPELYDAVDEYTQDENPSYLEERIQDVRKISDIVAYRLVKIEVPTKAVLDAFKTPTVEGTVSE